MFDAQSGSPTLRKKTKRDFLGLLNELEARDVVFRMDLDQGQRREKAPWVAQFGKGDLEKEDQAIWQQLFDGQITELEALDAMTALMERYYGMSYPLR